jgi:hypothetical protein
MAQRRWCTRQTYRQCSPIKNEAIQGNEQVKAIITQGKSFLMRITSTLPQSTQLTHNPVSSKGNSGEPIGGWNQGIEANVQ